MKLKFPIVLTFLLMPCFTSMPLRADELTAGELLSFCTSTDQVASTACRFYVLAVVQGVGIGDSAYMDATPKFVEKKKTIFCLPDNTPETATGDWVRSGLRGGRGSAISGILRYGRWSGRTGDN
jgi:hypothetical protein